MKTLELKKKLIDQINLSENKSLLEQLYSYLNSESEIQEIYHLNEEQRSAVKEARNQIKDGAFLTNEEANKEIDAWL